MTAASETTAQAQLYDDIEIPIFFDSSEDSEEPQHSESSTGKEAAAPVGERLSAEEVAADWEILRSAKEAQPWRDSPGQVLERVNAASWPQSDSLQAEFTDKSKPALVDGMLSEWRAVCRWASAEALVEHYARVPVTVTRLVAPGDLGKPMPVKVSLQCYLEYCQDTAPDYPFYVFDSDAPSSAMSQDYQALFEEDLFDASRYAPEHREALGFVNRLQWILVGPPRSSSPLHQDPLYTCAWNALLCGQKRWVCAPPSTPLHELLPAEDGLKSPALWFLETLPKLRARKRELGLLEFTQDAGQVVMLPEGWWHAVLNTRFSVAVTENALLPQTVESLYARLRESHPMLCGLLGLPQTLPVLHTERLDLRPLTVDDAASVFRHLSDECVTEFLVLEAKELSEARELVEYYLSSTACRWGIYETDSEVLIATAGLHQWQKCGIREIGYDLARAHRDKGFMSEALECMFGFAREHMHVSTLEASAHKENSKAQTVLLELGFKRTKDRGDDLFWYTREAEQ